MNNTRSNCCFAPMTVVSNNEGTCCYKCDKCGEPCDTAFQLDAFKAGMRHAAGQCKAMAPITGGPGPLFSAGANQALEWCTEIILTAAEQLTELP